MISQRMRILWPDKTDLSIYQIDCVTVLAQIKDLTVFAALMRGGTEAELLKMLKQFIVC